MRHMSSVSLGTYEPCFISFLTSCPIFQNCYYQWSRVQFAHACWGLSNLPASRPRSRVTPTKSTSSVSSTGVGFGAPPPHPPSMMEWWLAWCVGLRPYPQLLSGCVKQLCSIQKPTTSSLPWLLLHSFFLVLDKPVYSCSVTSICPFDQFRILVLASTYHKKKLLEPVWPFNKTMVGSPRAYGHLSYGLLTKFIVPSVK